MNCMKKNSVLTKKINYKIDWFRADIMLLYHNKFYINVNVEVLKVMLH